MRSRGISEVRAVSRTGQAHKAQAMCYAYIFALQHGIEHIGIQMTYVNLDTEEIKYFHEDFAFSALEEWFDE